MNTKIIVNGAHGRMGQLAVKTLEEHPEFNLVAALGRQDDLAVTIKKTKATIVIDLTNAESVFKNAQTIIEGGAHPVIGTSGLTKEQMEILQTACAKQKLGGLIVPNFSLGAVLMMKHAQAMAAYFPHVEIIELHHDGKLDSPSGTALRTAEMLAITRQTVPPMKTQKETVQGARGASYQNIPIHAVRLPGLVASQQVIFGGTGETLTIQHNTIDRQCFMPGVLLACTKVGELGELVYGLENII